MMLCKQVAQTEGVGFYYSENIYGVPPVLIQHVQKFPVLHEVNILITNRAVPVPDVMHKERILVETLGLPGFYHCICRSAMQLLKSACYLASAHGLSMSILIQARRTQLKLAMSMMMHDVQL